MSTRLQFHAFKGCSILAFTDTLDAVVNVFRNELIRCESSRAEGIDCRIASNQDVHTLYLACTNDLGQRIANEVGLRLTIPSLYLTISEGSIWEYTLHKGRICLDKFSVCPQYWNDDPEFVMAQRGNPDLLAATWSIPKERIVRYLVNWKMRDTDDATFEFTLSGKAYETDRYSYGEIWQVFDFLNALGGKDPVNLEAGARQYPLNLS